jgi:hypothetical protein
MATGVHAGTHLTAEHTGSNAPGGRRIDTLVQDGRLRLAGHLSQVLYYDHAARTAYVVDTVARTVVELSEARVQQMRDRLAGAERAMQEGLRGLADDRRARLEGMFRQGAGMPAAAPARPPLSFAKGGSGSVAAWPCERYTAADGPRTIEVCTASPNALGIAAADRVVLEGFLALMRRLARHASAMGMPPTFAEDDVPGIPVERMERRDGRLTDQVTLQSVVAETIPSADLQVPAGLRAETPAAIRTP